MKRQPFSSGLIEPTSIVFRCEAEVRRSFQWHLHKQGEGVRGRIRCSAGVPDIVTSEAVYEVEFALTKPKIFEAVGQVLLYRQAIDPLLRAVIVGGNTPHTVHLIPYIRQLGVGIRIWPEPHCYVCLRCGGIGYRKEDVALMHVCAMCRGYGWVDRDPDPE